MSLRSGPVGPVPVGLVLVGLVQVGPVPIKTHRVKKSSSMVLRDYEYPPTPPGS